MMYDNEVTLIGVAAAEPDDSGQVIETPVETKVLCKEKSIGHREFYAAAANGIRLERTLVIHRFEYDGQTMVRYNGQDLKVVRAYATGIEEIELICERVSSNG